MLEAGKTYFLGNYYPYWRVYRQIRNPKFDDFSSKVLDLKKSAGVKVRDDAVSHFVAVLNPITPSSWAIVHVPSSKPTNTNTGIYEVARRLATPPRVDASGCLCRTSEIPSLHSGGNRDQAVHLNSLTVRDPHLIANCDVLLLDDVTTSGGSLESGRKLLLQAGAKSVTTLAIGKTTHVD